MSTYICDCRKCTNSYYRIKDDGTVNYWCRPMIDTGVCPLLVEGTCGADYVISCDQYTIDPAVLQPYPDNSATRRILTDEAGKPWVVSDDHSFVTVDGSGKVVDQSEQRWLFAGYGWARCSKCNSEIPHNTPLPSICPKCGAHMQNRQTLEIE